MEDQTQIARLGMDDYMNLDDGVDVWLVLQGSLNFQVGGACLRGGSGVDNFY